LKKEQLLGYSVDSGTGCFMDAEAADILDNSIYAEAEEDVLVYKLGDLLEENQSRTWCCANMCLNSYTKVNVIAFSSGWGDGIYTTYLGYDKEGNIVCFATDFNLFPELSLATQLL
jgi:hypothetical protein